MSETQPIFFRDKRHPPEACRRCGYQFEPSSGRYWIGTDWETYRRPVCGDCFDIEHEAQERAAAERAVRCSNLVDLATYRERKEIRAPVSAG